MYVIGSVIALVLIFDSHVKTSLCQGGKLLLDDGETYPLEPGDLLLW